MVLFVLEYRTPWDLMAGTFLGWLEIILRNLRSDFVMIFGNVRTKECVQRTKENWKAFKMYKKDRQLFRILDYASYAADVTFQEGWKQRGNLAKQKKSEESMSCIGTEKCHYWRWNLLLALSCTILYLLNMWSYYVIVKGFIRKQ